MKALHIAILCVSVGLALVAQTPPKRPMPRTIPIACDHPSGPYSAAIKADRDGNVYVHFLNGAGASGSSGQILKISPDGMCGTRFDTASIPNSGRILDFTPSPGGDVYVLSLHRNLHATLLTRFSADGQLVYSNTLDTKLYATHIAALTGGNLVILTQGFWPGQKRIPLADFVRAVNIFTDTGKWLSTVSLRDAERRSTGSGSDLVDPDGPLPIGTRVPAGSTASNRPLGMRTDLVTSDDGEAFITRDQPYPMVFRVLPSGQVIRYDLPRPAGQIQLHRTVVADRRMLLSYQLLENTGKPNHFNVAGNVCELIDLESGRTLKLFPSPDTGHLVGFRSDTLLYFGPAKRANATKARFELREHAME